VKESKAFVGEDLYQFLIESGELIQVSQDVVFRQIDYQNLVSSIERYLKEANTLTVAEVRDLFKTTRKFALALMEYLDEVGITVREGDVRKLSTKDGRT
jgi:selenocysteine-specific elongation factor